MKYVFTLVTLLGTAMAANGAFPYDLFEAVQEYVEESRAGAKILFPRREHVRIMHEPFTSGPYYRGRCPYPYLCSEEEWIVNTVKSHLEKSGFDNSEYEVERVIDMH